MRRPPLLDMAAGATLGGSLVLAAVSAAEGDLWLAAFFALVTATVALLVWWSR